jgi:hypothetical protein
MKQDLMIKYWNCLLFLFTFHRFLPADHEVDPSRLDLPVCGNGADGEDCDEEDPVREEQEEDGTQPSCVADDVADSV